MWPWGRRQAEPRAAQPVLRGEWRALPPIQRVLPDHPLVNPVERFSSSLASWRSPAYLEPLAHRVASDEPSGLIDGLARPVVPRPAEPSVAMPLAHSPTRKPRGSVVQRLLASLRPPATAPTTAAPIPTPIPVSAQIPTPDVELATAEQVAAEQIAVEPAPAEPIALGSASAEPVPNGSASPEPVSPAPVLGVPESVQVERAIAPTETFAEPGLPIVGESRVERTVEPRAGAARSVEPPSVEPPSVVQRSVESAHRGSVPVSGTSVSVERPVVARVEARPRSAPPRLGLGLPRVEPAAGRAEEGSPSGGRTLDTGLVRESTGPVLGMASALPVLSEPDHVEAQLPVPEMQTAPGVTVVPSGLAPTIAAQRIVTSSVTASGTTAPGVMSSGSSERDGVLRSADVVAGVEPDRSTLGVGGQAGPPAPATSTAPVSAATARTARTTPNGYVQRIVEETGALLPRVRQVGLGAPVAVSHTTGTFVQRVEGPASTPEPQVPQRAAEVVVAREVADVPADAPDVSAAPAAAGPPASAGGPEPEELLKKLYDPLLRRLKAELWLDRERRGSLTDRWH